MAEFKGTKGKWEVKEHIQNIETDEVDICEMMEFENYEQVKANALLISKAPELLEALEHVLEILYQCDPPKGLHETYANALSNYNNLIEEATEL